MKKSIKVVAMICIIAMALSVMSVVSFAYSFGPVDIYNDDDVKIGFAYCWCQTPNYTLGGCIRGNYTASYHTIWLRPKVFNADTGALITYTNSPYTVYNKKNSECTMFIDPDDYLPYKACATYIIDGYYATQEKNWIVS